MKDTRARLAAPEVQALVARLGFGSADADAVLAAAQTVVDSDVDLARVDRLAARLLARVGDFTCAAADDPFGDEDGDAGPLGVGVLPMLALVATAPEVAGFHTRRGVAEDVSWRSLSDLGEQTRVHRQTFGEFGLHTFPWLRIAWSGALYWLGRLQFNLQRSEAEWVLSTHIPATGALTPLSVDDSFRWARQFFAEHFADYPSTDFYCSSWLLDPGLADVVSADSNLVRFQQRWRLYGEPMRGDSDALFFVFNRRGDVELDSLDPKTTLERGLVERLRSGRHFHVWQGRLPQSDIAPATTGSVRSEAHS